STYLAGTVRPGDLVTTDSGGAAALVRRHWERRGDDKSRVESRVSVPMVVALGVSAAAAAAALIF
ncbi:MAG: PH domain-containing protein, partial [Microbacteriaceae bacterium]|nr:PH domain-containing protein [Microbacteriaceae bacterium]